MITIKKSPTADTRTCDFTKVSKETLKQSSLQHIEDVKKGMQFWIGYLNGAGNTHDSDKISLLHEFHSDFITGFKNHEWWDNHRKVNRHHLNKPDGIPVDVDLIDVLEYVTDCVMAGKARSGEVTEITIDTNVLVNAFRNTVELLKDNVEVKE